MRNKVLVLLKDSTTKKTPTCKSSLFNTISKPPTTVDEDLHNHRLHRSACILHYGGALLSKLK
jgi:hypothetical protein